MTSLLATIDNNDLLTVALIVFILAALVFIFGRYVR